MKLRFYILIFLLFPIFSNAQDIENFLLPISSVQKEGIGMINSLAEDSQGYLWLATSSGLYQFDGNTLSKFSKLGSSLLKASFSYVFVDNDNTVWAGTFSQGLVQIDKTRNIVQNYLHRPNDRSSLADDRIKLIFQDYKGNIWISTHTSGLNKFEKENNNFSHYLPSDTFRDNNKRDINDFISHSRDVSNENIEWIGSLDGLLRFDVDQKKYELFYCDKISITEKESLNELENQVRNISFLDEGMFLGTWGGGLCKLDTVNNIWDCFKYESPFPKSHVRNNIFFGKINKHGKFIVSIQDNTFEYFPETDKLVKISNLKLFKYFVDSKGQEWFVFGRNKLFVRTSKSTLFQTQSLNESMSCFYYDQENGLFYNGVYRESKIVITDALTFKSREINYKPVHDNGLNWVTSIYKDTDGQVIFHENRDLYTLKNDKLVLYFDYNKLEGGHNISKNSNLISFVDSDNEIWTGYKKFGILRVDPSTNNFRHYTEKDGIQHSGWISEYMEDSHNRIWYGSEKSLGYFDKEEDRFFNISDSLRAFKYTSSIIEDKNQNIWVGEGNNILKIKVFDDHNYSLKSISSTYGVGHNIDLCSLDSEGNLWGFSSKGLFWFDTKKESFKLWGRAYGFRNIIDLMFCENDSLLVVNRNGYLKGNPQDLFKIPEDVKLSYTNLKLFNKDYNPWGKAFGELNEIDLSYKQNFISIGFSLNDILKLSDIQFEYKLTGLRDSWISLGSRNYVEFSHLNPGKYTLQVRKINIGEEPSYSKVLSISITPPFWQTWWFRLFSLLIMGYIVYGWVEQRKRKLEDDFNTEVALQKRLANVEMMALKSQMNPHFVFNCLNTIKLFVLENETEKASRYISDFAKLLRTALNDSRLDLTTLSSEIESIRLYIELEKMRFDQRFDYKIVTPKDIDLDRYKVPPMLIQPFVENAIQHGILPLKSTGELIVDIDMKDGYFVYSIIDNGIGRAASAIIKKGNNLNPSLGINITNERLNLVKTLYGMEASIQIFDIIRDGKALGTKVVVKIPVLEE